MLETVYLTSGVAYSGTAGATMALVSQGLSPKSVTRWGSNNNRGDQTMALHVKAQLVYNVIAWVLDCCLL